ncbi:ATP-binding protein [Kushneria aurantia]|uniref:AAA family ATPase n=1 Tax=Kushneria aurantia TaxID=504092 RepID=A0ABV6G255_9GAMM|nr:ATP-binding protein [Kushneria aurantia]
MDPFSNPFAPGAGSRPPELAGRDPILQTARISCGRAIRGRAARSMMLLGLRGTGKTVLLSEIGRIAESEKFLVSRIEAPEETNLAALLHPEMRKISRALSGIEAARHHASRALGGLRNFASVFNIEVAGVNVGVEPPSEPGMAESGDMQHDLPDIFDQIGRAAQAADRGWVLLIDEIQYLSRQDLSALIVALHRMSQDGRPIIFIGAGLPQVARLAGEAKSYAERLFSYPAVGPLDEEAVTKAIEKPIRDEGASISREAVAAIFDMTKGYPFFLQELASFAWNNARGTEIDESDIHASHAETISSLDNGFFRVRLDRLTKAEVSFVKAMATLGDGPYQVSDIAKRMERTQKSIGPARASIIYKGMIYSTDHGYLDFTVPLFADFIRRKHSPDG